MSLGRSLACPDPGSQPPRRMSGARAPLPCPGWGSPTCCAAAAPMAPCGTAPCGTAACPGGSARIFRRAQMICKKSLSVRRRRWYNVDVRLCFYINPVCAIILPLKIICKCLLLCGDGAMKQILWKDMMYLDTGEHHQELDGKVRELKHHAAALCAPLLLPIVQPVGYEAPAHTYEGLLCDDLLPCTGQSQPGIGGHPWHREFPRPCLSWPRMLQRLFVWLLFIPHT